MNEPYRVAIYAAPGTPSRALNHESGDDVDNRHSDEVGSALRERAEAWIGRAVDGRVVASEAPAGWTRERVDRLSVDARRYGFHGTLKAPFRIAEGCGLTELDHAVAQFATARERVVIPSLTLTRLGGFYALTAGPDADASRLDALSDATVTELDSFRAPLTATERERRRPERLSERQRRLLDDWGYPYVLGESRFHLTLTDRIAPEDQDEVREVLLRWFADSLDRDIRVDVLAVFVEPEPGAPFELYSTHRLVGSPTSSAPQLHAEDESPRPTSAHARPNHPESSDPTPVREDAR
jgi:hypothetical protein